MSAAILFAVIAKTTVVDMHDAAHVVVAAPLAVSYQ